MRKFFNFKSDSGFSMVLALSVAFIVFALGAVWVATSNTELDQVVFYEHRTAAQNAAEAGARWAMAALADDIVDPEWVGVDASNATTALTLVGIREALNTYSYVARGTSNGALGGECDLVPQRASAAGEQLGEWWARITPIDAANWIYQVESWGWAPRTTSRQVAAQKVSIQVRLVPDSSGFTHALFAEARLSGVNFKEVYGDVYAGATADITNSTELYANDAGYPGVGRLRVNGDLLIGSGSNNYFQGRVDIQGTVQDAHPGSDYSDLWVRNDESADTSTTNGAQSYFKGADVTGEARFVDGGNPTTWTGAITGVVVSPVTGMADVPTIPLPVFTWDATDYTSQGYTVYEWDTVADFDAWFAANDSALSGVHYIKESATLNLDFNGAEMSDHFMVVSEGSMNVTKMPSTAPSPDPLTLILVMADDDGRLTTSNQVISVDGVLHLLLFSNGEFDAANQTTVFGAIYGVDDISANRVEVHFRPPEDSLVEGFDFSKIVPDSFTAQPLVWRSVGVDEPTPITDYCGVPGGAAASVPTPTTTTLGVTTTTTTSPTTTTTTAPTTTTTLPSCILLPNGKCKKK